MISIKIFDIQYVFSWKSLILSPIMVWMLGAYIFTYYFKGLHSITYWWLSIAAIMMLYGSVLLHELPCILFATHKRKKAVFRITPFWSYRSISHPFSPKMELLLGGSGLLLNLLVFMLCSQIPFVMRFISIPKNAVCIIDFVRISNIGLFILNILPFSHFDGGKLFSCAMSLIFRPNIKEVVCDVVNNVVSIGFIAFGIWELLNGRFTFGIIVSGIGIALREICLENRYRIHSKADFDNAKIHKHMDTECVSVPISISNHEFFEKYASVFPHNKFPVVGKDNFFRGAVSLNTVYRTLSQIVTLESLVKKNDEWDVVCVSDSVKKAKVKMINGSNVLFVVDNHGFLKGIFTIKMLIELIISSKKWSLINK